MLDAQIMEDAVRKVEYMGGIVWAEGNVLKVRVERPDHYAGKTVRLHVS